MTDTQRQEGGNGVVRWRSLDREGCQYGVRMLDRVGHVEGKVDDIGEEVNDLKRKMDRTFWALVMAAVAFGSAALMLGVQLAMQ